jgi:HAD superfamily hydrolase (TIGR01509 family)
VRLLDLYDTIVWTDWAAVSAWLSKRLEVAQEALFRAYLETRPERGRGLHGSVVGDVKAIAVASGSRLQGSELVRLSDDLVAFMSGSVRYYDEVLPTLREWRASGFRVAVISNCDHITRPVVEHLGLEREVDAVLLSCELGLRKPEAALFAEGLRRLDARVEDGLFVDDQPDYLEGADRLGLLALQVVRAPTDGRDTREPPPPTRFPVVSDLRGVDAFLMRGNR